MLGLVEAGFTTFDCGDIYLGVEDLLGRVAAALSARTNHKTAIEVHTKFVPDLDELSRIRKTDVERIIDRSLGRLRAQRLDLVQFMWWDYTVPGYVETAWWLDEIRKAGKIHLLGATNFDVPHLREIVDSGVQIASHQVQYSLLDRRPKGSMERFCKERKIPLLAYGSLAGGFLSDLYLGRAEPPEQLPNRSLVKYRLIIDECGGWTRFQELLAVLNRIALRHRVSISNVATAWTLARDQVAAVIVGAADASHLEDNLRTFDLFLDERDLVDLEPFDHLGPQGDVYSAERDRTSRHGATMKYNLNSDPPE